MNACTRKELISEEEVKKIVLKDANVENANFYKFDLKTFLHFPIKKLLYLD